MIEISNGLVLFLSLFAIIGVIVCVVVVIDFIYTDFTKKTISFEVYYKTDIGTLICLKDVKKIKFSKNANKIIVKCYNEKSKTYEIHYINEWDFINGVRLYEA